MKTVFSFKRIASVAVAALALVVAPSAVFAHSAKVKNIEITSPFTRATLPGAPTAGGYFTAINSSDKAERLVSASSPLAERVEIHEMSMKNDVMSMQHLPEGIEIPANGSVVLAPSGLHLMFFGLKQPFVEGEVVSVKLQFELAGEVPVAMHIESMGARETTHDHSGHSTATPEADAPAAAHKH